ncbi:hypothetical protein ACHAPT_006469 [Fusarium lateritium]
MNAIVLSGMGQIGDSGYSAVHMAPDLVTATKPQSHAQALGARAPETDHGLPYIGLDRQSQQIRLLELHPGGGGDSVSSSFRHVELSSCPSYTALSYTWGPIEEVATRSINVDGRGRIPVRDNLWLFLRLQSSVITEPKLLWVDAICVDQANIYERNHQVKLMKDIYSKAAEVYVWLGSQADKSDMAMDFIAKKGTRGLRPKGFGYYPLWTKEVGKAIYDLCDRGYWRRMWIIQELVHAANITVWCGTKSFQWHTFESLYRTLKNLESKSSSVSHVDAIRVLQSSAFVMIWQRAHWRHPDTPAPRLQTLTTVFRNCQSTDARDKVYALVSMASPETAIVVDYSKSALEIYYAVQAIHDGDKEQFYDMLAQVLGVSGVDLDRDADERLMMRSARALRVKPALETASVEPTPRPPSPYDYRKYGSGEFLYEPPGFSTPSGPF